MPHPMTPLRDGFSRLIDYMRVSVTDRCNLRCIYCMPPEDTRPIIYKNILRYEEIIRIIGTAAGLGVGKIRITGGEPLARKNVQYLIKAIHDIDGIEDISLTTNGVLLEKYADELKECGLIRVNVSLDSLRSERYNKITRGGDLKTVLRGIEKAYQCGLRPLKINMVPIRGLNDDEIPDFARLTLRTPYHVRFIELMPIGDNLFNKEKRHYIDTAEIKERVENIGLLAPVKVRRSGPARYFRLPGAEGVIGLISSMTRHSCRDCNRLRVTSDGKLRPCLFSETEIDLKSPLRKGATDSEIERLLRLAVEVKPEGRGPSVNLAVCGPMSKIGG